MTDFQDNPAYRAEGVADCGCEFGQDRRDYSWEIKPCPLHAKARALADMLKEYADGCDSTPSEGNVTPCGTCRACRAEALLREVSV